jgi:hypothetical protein
MRNDAGAKPCAWRSRRQRHAQRRRREAPARGDLDGSAMRNDAGAKPCAWRSRRQRHAQRRRREALRVAI